MKILLLIFFHVRNYFAVLDKNLPPWFLNLYTSNAMVAFLFMIAFSIYMILGMIESDFIIQVNNQVFLSLFFVCLIVANIVILIIIKKSKKQMIEMEEIYSSEIAKTQSVRYGTIICWSVISFFVIAMFSRVLL